MEILEALIAMNFTSSRSASMTNSSNKTSAFNWNIQVV